MTRLRRTIGRGVAEFQLRNRWANVQDRLQRLVTLAAMHFRRDERANRRSAGQRVLRASGCSLTLCASVVGSVVSGTSFGAQVDATAGATPANPQTTPQQDAPREPQQAPAAAPAATPPATPPATTTGAPPAETIPTEPDPEATAALAALAKAYRERPSLRVREEVTVIAAEDGAEEASEPKKIELLFGSGTKSVIKLNSYELRFSDGKVWATHESNPDTYLEASDADSPYWTMIAAFIEVPFVSFALKLGEEAPEDLVMQLHPRTPDVIPAKVINDTAPDGSKRQRIVLLAEGQRLELTVDPERMLLTKAVATATAGINVPKGAELEYRSAIVNEIPPKPFEDEAFRLDHGKREKVEMFAQLPKKEAMRANAGGGGGGALVGKPAPEFSAVSSQGGLVKSEDLLGRVVVLDFWATWCGPCRLALPELVKLETWARAEQLPVVVYPMNVFERTQGEERLKAIAQTLQTLKVTLPTLIDDKDKAAGAFGVKGIPMTVVIRADGIVHAQHNGFSDDYLELLKTDVKAAIAAVERGGGQAAKPEGAPAGDANPPNDASPNPGPEPKADDPSM